MSAEAEGPHPLCLELRSLRRAAGYTLTRAQEEFGTSAVVIGSWERGDREVTVRKLDMALHWFGYKLAAVPLGEEAVRQPKDMVTELRTIADQLEKNNALPVL